MIGPVCAVCEIEDAWVAHESCRYCWPRPEIELLRLHRVERPVWRQLGARRPPVEL